MEKIENSSSANEARPWQSYHTVYTNSKAGMEGVDKEKVQRVVYEMSKGSKYFENEERKEAAMRQKIERMRAQCAKLSAADISRHQMVAEKRIVELEAARDLSRIWLHVDMDAFYAAVETICNPSLKGKPMAVGSMSMLSTANYEARKYGVRAAMPGFIARKLCPDLIFVPTDFKKYTHYSDLTRKVFRKYDPNFIAGSLDEAYLDITNVCKDRCLSGGEIAEELRASVYEETGLTCSAGVAPNRLLAKVCSDVNKPNGQFVLPNDRMAVMTFISSLPIRKIGGIGKVTEHILKDVFGINTCKDILEKGGLVCAFFSHSTAVGIGLGSTDTPEARSRKSISNERTFSATGDKAILHKKLAELAELLSSDMQKEGLSGRTLTLKLKTASFEKYICSTEDILKYASKLLKDELPVSLRLIGRNDAKGYKNGITFFRIMAGLRISQFNEEKDGGPVDPTQKSITNFIVPGEAYSKRKGAQSSSLSENTDDHFLNSMETGLSSDSHQNDIRDTSDDHHLSDLDLYNTTLHDNADDLDNDHAILNDCSSSLCFMMTSQKDDPSNMVENCKGSNLPEGSELLEVGSSKQDNCDYLDRPSILKNETASSSNEEQLLWVDDYKCSLCGIELPPSFIEERQEHSDFHIAERLQREESGNASRSLMPRPRIVQKDHNAGQGRRKKLKSSREGRHIPIDLFFVKKDQNS